MYLLLKDDIIKSDNTFSKNLPFQISTEYNNLKKDAYLGFENEELGLFFIQKLNLDGYKCAQLDKIGKEKLMACKGVVLIRKRSDIDRMLQCDCKELFDNEILL